MSYSVDKDKALAVAEQRLEDIKRWRETDVEHLVQEELNNNEKWHRRIPFLFKKLTKEQALDRIKGSDEYWLATKISYGRCEDAMLNIIKSCKNTSGTTILVGDEDFHYLPL